MKLIMLQLAHAAARRMHNRRLAVANRCACYTTNDGYLLPTVISALQARQHSGAEVDVVICHIGRVGPAAEAAAAVCAAERIGFLSVDADAIDHKHVMFARLFLDRILPDRYRRVLYLDGDTQIAGSLAPLLDAAPPPGGLLAAPDPMILTMERLKGRRAYLDDIGLGRAGFYFNSGVLRFDRDAIGDIREACLRAPAWNDRALMFPDQDVLNIVCGDRVGQISFKWNFPIFFLNCGLRAPVDPQVFHFMSNPRPWHGAFRPWGEEFAAVYRRAVAQYPPLAASLAATPRWKRLKYWAQQQIKARMESQAWNTAAMRDKVQALESRAVV